jgi:integrase
MPSKSTKEEIARYSTTCNHAPPSSSCTKRCTKGKYMAVAILAPGTKTDAGIRDIDLAPALAALVKKYIGNRTNGFLFETSSGLPMSPRNIARDSLHSILKKIGRELAGFHTFRRFRESILQMSEARTLPIDFWMGHANREMSGVTASSCSITSSGGEIVRPG